MGQTLNDDLAYEILSVVEEIPEGKVTTYGTIARLVGRERNARLVGRVLSRSRHYGDYPCHRVVNHEGRLAPGWPEQRDLLEDEGVPFKDPDHVDLSQASWDGQ
ncbi:MAG: MGMT family protein [Bifidobacterium sp.]|nr:MGMT family protein [Bifidobacterium sp.]